MCGGWPIEYRNHIGWSAFLVTRCLGNGDALVLH